MKPASAGIEPESRWWFITRKYPPAVGGMERLAYEVTTRLAKRRRLTVVAPASRAGVLPGFFITSTFRLLVGCIKGEVSLLHLGDPVLAPLAGIARVFGVPTTVTIHGLDVAYRQPMYRLWRRLFLRGFEAYVCISEVARAAAIAASLPAERLHVIGIGVDVPNSASNPVVRESDLLLFVGRLVPRKGLAWFVREVLPRIAARRPRLRLAILGDGPERVAIVSVAAAVGVADRLIWLGMLDNSAKADWFARAAICVMPNVVIDDDLEGFGIVALEAAAAGCALLAADLQGLREAVADGQSGRLVPPEDRDAWVAALAEWLDDEAARTAAGARGRRYVARCRGWTGIIDAYEALFVQIAATKGGTRRR
ncbi:MAG: glycosyltransferase [Casimicrobiaceae bacterium]